MNKALGREFEGSPRYTPANSPLGLVEKGPSMLRNVSCTVLAFVALATAGSQLASAAQPQTQAAANALAYVRTLQNPDGGFPAFGSDSSAGATIDALFAFTAAGIDPATVAKGGNSPLDYLGTQVDSYTTTPGHTAKLVLGLAAAGEDPRAFAGHDLVASMNSNFNGASHSYGDGVLDHEVYMLARARLHLSPATGSADYLKSKQISGGCWEFSDGFGCDTNTTALGIEALLAAGVAPSDSAAQAALDYLGGAQNDDGGFPYDPLSSWGTDSDANSTAFVLQALVAAGEDIDAGGGWQAPGGTTPLEALLGFQNPQTGAFTYSGEDNAYATYQSIPALLLQPYPGAPKTSEREATATPKPTKTPVATATPTVALPAEPTATPLPSVVVPTVVGPPLSAPLSREVAGITIAAAGEGAGGHRDGASVPLMMVLLIAGAGALTATAGLTRRLRRR
jgi:hypothetical protein